MGGGDDEKEPLKIRMRDQQVKWIRSLDADDRAEAWNLIGKSLLEISPDELKLLDLKLDIIAEAAETKKPAGGSDGAKPAPGASAKKKVELTDAERQANLQAILEAADDLLKRNFSKSEEAGGTTTFFSYYGCKPKKPETKEEKKVDKKMKFAKGVLVNTLKRKAEALRKLCDLETSIVSVEDEKEAAAGDGF